MEATLSALSVRQLSVHYEQRTALWEITASIPPGKLVGIIGPNGAGKSTLLKALLGIVKPFSGHVQFFGHSLPAVRQRVAYVPQRESVDWDFPITVGELVLMGRYGRLGLFRRPKNADLEAVERYLEMVEMGAYIDRQISQLSGGQQQRVFLARALIQEADLYLLDEPFSGIDMASESAIMDVLRKLRSTGKSLLVVHHDLTTVESYFDWALLINVRLVACGPLLQVFNAETLHATYGKNYALFGELCKLSQSRNLGTE